MTLVAIDIRNIASETHPDDRVVFYSPTFREAPGGGITSTAETVVPLVDGVGEKELAPGPVTVTFQCRGISDTRPKSGTVPDTGPVGVEDVIAGAFEYTPAVVNRGLEQIEGARDEALGQVAGAVVAEVDQIKWVRRQLLDEHLDTIAQPGTYGATHPEYITSTNGYPRAASRVTLEVAPTNPGNPNTYFQTLRYVDGETWTRERYGASTWSAWSSPTTDAVKRRGTLTADKSLNDLKFSGDAGLWVVLNTATATTLGLPDPGAGSLIVEWIVGGSTPYAVQKWVPVSTGIQWTRANDSYKWSAWSSPTTDAAKLVPPMTAEARRDQLIASRGGRIGTGGRGVVAFRFDHNVAPFQQKILPLLRERGLPASMAHFANEMTPDSSYTGSDEVGKTWADVATQFYQGVEVWSHSWSHTDAATEQALQKEIVESRAELESKIPEASVVGWMQPGLTGTRYMGYGDVFNTPERHGTTRAGQLIEATYGADDRSGATTTP